MDKLNILIIAIAVLIIFGFLFNASSMHTTTTKTVLVKQPYYYQRNPYHPPPPHYNSYKAQYYNQY